MSSMVSEYIIRPALQQVRRRFSRSSAASEAEQPSSPYTKPRERRPSHDDAISETEEDLYLSGAGDSSASASVSSPYDSPRSLVPRHTTSETADRFPASAFAHDNASRLLRDAAHGDFERGAPVSLLASQISESRGLDTTDTAMATVTRSEVTDANPPAMITGVLDTTEPVVDAHVPLPEDDGMGVLRRKIIDIQSRRLPAPEQAQLVHQLLMENYKKSHIEPELERPESPSSVISQEKKQAHSQTRLDPFKLWHDFIGDGDDTPEYFVLTQDDVAPTYAPLGADEEDSEYRVLGCDHYKRNVKSQCSTCNRWYTCRFCHDAAESHTMAAKDTKNMLCMFCGTAQKVGEACVNCSEPAAMYYCSICKLWNNDPDRSVYHCADCGICRVGMGLGKDYFHCKTCNACLAISLENDHRCIERLLDCDCPICGEYMFNSPRGICHMKCGHTLHKDCWSEHIKHAYKCPICSKSIVNMETQFRRLDLAIDAQPMPEKFQDTRAVVACNDCSAKTTVRYHWLGLKCAVCQSYNTSQLQILGSEAGTLQRAAPVEVEVHLAETGDDGPGEILQPAQTVAARDIPRRRRHSSNLMQLATGVSDPNTLNIGSFVVQDRLARSVSPVAALHQANAEESDDEESKEDIMGFWSRISRSITSGDELEDEDGSGDESDSSLDDGMDDDDEDEEEDEITLFGHR